MTVRRQQVGNGTVEAQVCRLVLFKRIVYLRFSAKLLSVA